MAQVLEKQTTTLEDLYESFMEGYTQGNFVEGLCEWNGDDALMGPRSFAHSFKKKAEEMGFEFEDYKPFADELEEWCQEHLGHLESKFR